MSFNEQQLEDRLRKSPAPKAPASLRKQLLAQVNLPRSEADLQRSVTTVGFGGWLRRWWPAVAPAALSLACGVVMAVQRLEITDLQQSIQNVSQSSPDAAAVSQPTAPLKGGSASITAHDARSDETAQLKERVKQLRDEISQLEQKRTENESFRKELATPTGLTAEEQAELDAAKKARERALRTACVNNMKQLGIALRGYEIDLGVFPPDVLSMTNEINSPKVIICPADTNRVAAANWKTYTLANCSYEFLAANGSSTEPDRVAFRCPIHYSIGLCDGSVQSLTPQSYSESVFQRDGKTYYQYKAK